MGLLNFLSKKSPTERPGRQIKTQAYDATTAALPPMRGAYPVAGNGPNALDRLHRSQAKFSESQLSVAGREGSSAPGTGHTTAPRPRFLDDEQPSNRPTSAPQSAQPKSPAWQGHHQQGPRRESLRAPPPPVAFRSKQPAEGSVSLGASPQSAQFAEGEYPPLPSQSGQGGQGQGQGYYHAMSPANGGTLFPAGGRMASPRSDGGVAGPGVKGYVDILDAHAEIRPANNFRHRVRASGARDYGEDVADRNIGENGVDLMSPQVQAFYAQAPTGGSNRSSGGGGTGQNEQGAAAPAPSVARGARRYVADDNEVDEDLDDDEAAYPPPIPASVLGRDRLARGSLDEGSLRTRSLNAASHASFPQRKSSFIPPTTSPLAVVPGLPSNNNNSNKSTAFITTATAPPDATPLSPPPKSARRQSLSSLTAAAAPSGYASAPGSSTETGGRRGVRPARVNGTRPPAISIPPATDDANNGVGVEGYRPKSSGAGLSSPAFTPSPGGSRPPHSPRLPRDSVLVAKGRNNAPLSPRRMPGDFREFPPPPPPPQLQQQYQQQQAGGAPTGSLSPLTERPSSARPGSRHGAGNGSVQQSLLANTSAFQTPKSQAAGRKRHSLHSLLAGGGNSVVGGGGGGSSPPSHARRGSASVDTVSPSIASSSSAVTGLSSTSASERGGLLPGGAAGGAIASISRVNGALFADGLVSGGGSGSAAAAVVASADPAATSAPSPRQFPLSNPAGARPHKGQTAATTTTTPRLTAPDANAPEQPRADVKTSSEPSPPQPRPSSSRPSSSHHNQPPQHPFLLHQPLNPNSLSSFNYHHHSRTASDDVPRPATSASSASSSQHPYPFNSAPYSNYPAYPYHPYGGRTRSLVSSSPGGVGRGIGSSSATRLDEIAEHIPVRTSSLRNWSISSATPTMSSTSSNPFPRPASRHTANTSVDLSAGGGGGGGGSRSSVTSGPVGASGAGAGVSSAYCPPAIETKAQSPAKAPPSSVNGVGRLPNGINGTYAANGVQHHRNHSYSYGLHHHGHDVASEDDDDESRPPTGVAPPQHPSAAGGIDTPSYDGFNIDDYLSSDGASSDGEVNNNNACRRRDAGEEELLFRDTGYGMGGMQLPGLLEKVTVVEDLSPTATTTTTTATVRGGGTTTRSTSAASGAWGAPASSVLGGLSPPRRTGRLYGPGGGGAGGFLGTNGTNGGSLPNSPGGYPRSASRTSSQQTRLAAARAAAAAARLGLDSPGGFSPLSGATEGYGYGYGYGYYDSTDDDDDEEQRRSPGRRHTKRLSALGSGGAYGGPLSPASPGGGRKGSSAVASPTTTLPLTTTADEVIMEERDEPPVDPAAAARRRKEAKARKRALGRLEREKRERERERFRGIGKSAAAAATSGSEGGGGGGGGGGNATTGGGGKATDGARARSGSLGAPAASAKGKEKDALLYSQQQQHRLQRPRAVELEVREGDWADGEL